MEEDSKVVYGIKAAGNKASKKEISSIIADMKAKIEFCQSDIKAHEYGMSQALKWIDVYEKTINYWQTQLKLMGSDGTG